MTDLERAYAALAAKQPIYDTLWAYYDGDQPLVYTARRLRDIFERLDGRFNENWCAVVIDSVADRISFRGFTVADNPTAQDTLSALADRINLLLDADDATRAALVCGEAYLIAWPDAEGRPDAYYNDPRLCHLFYDPEAPRRPWYGCKWWTDADGRSRLVLYYADRIERYVSRGSAASVRSARSYDPDGEPEDNPYGEVPIFHLRPERRRVKSDLTDAIPLQNAINKLLIDMMVTAEFAAFPQRYVISQAETLGKLKNAANEVWDLPAGDGEGQATSVGQFAAADLRIYTDAITTLSSALGAITRTPRHYFFQQGGDPSGESLIAMEAPLNKKVQDRIDRFVPVWRDIAAFLLRIAGVTVDPRAIQPLFDRPETVQPLTEAKIIQAETTAGVPLLTAVRGRGWDAARIAQMQMDLAGGDLPAAMTEEG